ncbi:hypothetical protein [Streptomyces parvulus]|uniref:hypothetical protein n=1 Tax=Streptomyces parvulus TaxID=146923 RepID=UPI00370218B8
MIWSAVLPGAALRVTRTAAGRRALHVALLVGGLFVLGLLCGERAQAADGTSSPRDAVHQVADSLSARTTAEGSEAKEAETNGRVTEDGTSPDRTSSDRTSPAHTSALLPLGSPHPVREVVRSVTDRVVRPVADVVEQTVERVTLPVAPSGSGSGSVTLPGSPHPTDPSASPWPSLPSLPELPVLSGDPAPDDPPASAGPDAPHHRRPAPAETAAPSGTTEARPATTPADTVDVTGVAANLAYGPAPVALDGGAETRTPDAGEGGRRVTPVSAEYVPTGHAPTGAPDGSLGSAAGADQGMPRHGDAHAVTPHHRMPFRFVTAVPERADAGETRDPYRDIPVSPA